MARPPRLTPPDTLASSVASWAVFLAAYASMFRLALADLKEKGKYTLWVYAQTLCLLPLLPHSSMARAIALANTFGLGLGIHAFYAVTRYRLLREFGDDMATQAASRLRRFTGPRHPAGAVRLPLLAYLAGDAAVHWTPFAVAMWAQARWGARRTKESTTTALAIAAPRLPSRIWVGIVTGFFHATYCFFLTGSWDPAPLYGVSQTRYTQQDIAQAWAGLFSAHVLGAFILL